MKRLNLIFIILLCASTTLADEIPAWHEVPLSLGAARIKTIAYKKVDNQELYIGTDQGLYISRRDGSSMTRVPQIALRGEVNDLFISEDSGMILAATMDGAFESRDQGKSWRTIYNGKVVNAIAHTGRYTFIGTANGVYSKGDKEEHFSRLPGLAGTEASYALRESSGRIYSLGDEHLYLIRPETRATEIIYSMSGSDDDTETVEESEEREGETRFLRAIEIIEGAVYLATTHGIHFSQDHGQRWEEVPTDGLVMSGVNSLVTVGPFQDHGTLCAGTDQGLFCRINNFWNQVNEGVPDNRVLCLLKASNADLYAVSEKGIYVLSNATGSVLASLAHQQVLVNCAFKDYASLDQDFTNEPGIAEVHAMAVKYSDTDTKKIAAWHRQSRARALIPHVSVGLDRDTGDMWHWDTGPNPDNLQKGREHRDWDLTVTWELADLIWSSNQTSIDSRSKLMTELRQEVLDQVTRIYFERRRLQFELVSCNYPSTGEKMAAAMRVHELTALIDAYTGGGFTGRLNHRSNSKT